MNTGKFCEKSHRAFVVVLYYFGIRKSEALKALRRQFWIERGNLIFDVGKRKKRSKRTPPLKIATDKPFIPELIEHLLGITDAQERVFNFCSRTAYNITERFLDTYPHYFRLSRITNELNKGRTIPEMKTFTGLTLTALDSYVGIVTIDKIAKDLD